MLFIESIADVVLSENKPSVNVKCPVVPSVASVKWFMYSTNTTVINVFNGTCYAINALGRYYCQVTEQRGIYRSNTFTVYKAGKHLTYTYVARNFPNSYNQYYSNAMYVFSYSNCVCVHTYVCMCVCKYK